MFASNEAINFCSKGLPDINITYTATKEFNRLNPKQVNLFSCWEEKLILPPAY
jgi:4-hydroxythreonine-4-phosphate dehydrogenase